MKCVCSLGWRWWDVRHARRGRNVHHAGRRERSSRRAAEAFPMPGGMANPPIGGWVNPEGGASPGGGGRPPIMPGGGGGIAMPPMPAAAAARDRPSPPACSPAPR